jgi:hypothetical protein
VTQKIQQASENKGEIIFYDYIIQNFYLF